MIEEWRDIKDYEGYYQVSNLGRVKSLARVIESKSGYWYAKREEFLNGSVDSNGYILITLINKNKKHKRLHQLVAEAFLNHTPNGHKIVVDHIDNDKSNNRVDNLQLITTRENNSKDKKNKTSKYTGVSWNKKSNKWVAHIKINGKSKHLGYFENEDEASEAYQKALRNLD